MAARLEGALATSVTTGLGVKGESPPPILPRSGGVVVNVIWPYGWTARRVGEDILLFDATGALVARTGDHVAFAGGFVEGSDPSASARTEGGFAVCGGPIPATSPAP